MAVSMCIVHLIITVSTGDKGSLSISLVEKITTISSKVSGCIDAKLSMHIQHETLKPHYFSTDFEFS